MKILILKLRKAKNLQKKKAVISLSNKVDFETKNITRDKEGALFDSNIVQFIKKI